MGTIADYDTLAAALKSWCARSDSKFSAQIPLFVSLTEDRIYDGAGTGPEDPLYTPPLRAAIMETTTTLTLSNGSQVLPTDFLDSRRLNRAGDKTGIDYLPPHRFAYEAEIVGVGTTPIYYTIETRSLKVIPTYDGDLQLLYYRRFAPITSGNKTGDLIEAHGNIYLDACLFYAFAWMQERETAMDHLALYRSYVAGVNKTAHRTRQPGQRMRVNVRNPIP